VKHPDHVLIMLPFQTDEGRELWAAMPNRFQALNFVRRNLRQGREARLRLEDEEEDRSTGKGLVILVWVPSFSFVSTQRCYYGQQSGLLCCLGSDPDLLQGT
jgi:hypothetical protein